MTFHDHILICEARELGACRVQVLSQQHSRLSSSRCYTSTMLTASANARRAPHSPVSPPVVPNPRSLALATGKSHPSGRVRRYILSYTVPSGASSYNRVNPVLRNDILLETGLTTTPGLSQSAQGHQAGCRRNDQNS